MVMPWSPSFSADLQAKARKIRLVLTDCDGVLTDGGVYYSARGEQMKRFNIRDGMGVRLLRERLGIETGIITGERSESVVRRAEKLGIQHLYLGCDDKLTALREIGQKLALPLERIAYMGDDVNDLDVLRQVGLSACPADALDDIRRKVDLVCRRFGGHGAFREMAELLLAVQDGKATP